MRIQRLSIVVPFWKDGWLLLASYGGMSVLSSSRRAILGRPADELG